MRGSTASASARRSGSGGPTVSSYSSKNRNTATPASRNSTPNPNRNVPQPTPRHSSKPRAGQHQGPPPNNSNTRGGGRSSSGLVSTPANSRLSQSQSRTSPVRLKSQHSMMATGSAGSPYSSAAASAAASENTATSGIENAMFSRALAEKSDFKTQEARNSLLTTVDTERQLQELAKARRDRSLEVLQVYRDEADQWQQRMENTQAKLLAAERRRLDLAAQSREVETEALNLRYKLRTVQKQRQQKQQDSAAAGGGGGGASSRGGGGSNADPAPHTIIRSVLQKYNTIGGGGDDGDSSSDDEYAYVLNRDGGADAASGSSPVSGSPGALWFTNAGKKKKRKLSKAERIQAAGKISVELEKSIRTTRLSVESRVAELEATLSEVASLQNQKIGFGITLDEMRERVKAVHDAVKQASWLKSCLPLLEQTVAQREALAGQGEEYGKRVLDSLMQLNKRDDENVVMMQERAERNLLRPEDLIKMVQEENQHMSKELSEAVRDAESWRASMQQQSEKYQLQLRETEVAIDEASKQRRMSLF